MVHSIEQVSETRWKEMTANCGDSGRDALLSVATRHLERRLSEVVREVPGRSYVAAAQGTRKFRTR